MNADAMPIGSRWFYTGIFRSQCPVHVKGGPYPTAVRLPGGCGNRPFVLPDCPMCRNTENEGYYHVSPDALLPNPT
jgi:hypothetical protein